MSQYKNPDWWTEDNDTAWERVKKAMQRDWDQTKHDMGGDQPDLKQNIGNTTRQASGKETIPPRGKPATADSESAYRFGHGARSKYSEEYPDWDDDLETRLKTDWQAADSTRDWKKDRAAIRYGWNYDED